MVPLLLPPRKAVSYTHLDVYKRQQQQLANAQQPVVEEAEEVVVTDANIAPRTVFFKIGSDKLSPQEEMNLSYLASKMKEFPNMTYTINGYADSATGTPSINQKLSLELSLIHISTGCSGTDWECKAASRQYVYVL